MLPSLPFLPVPSARVIAARLRALSAARLAVTILLGGCGGEAAVAAARPREGSARSADECAAVHQDARSS
jgi:hypothetical protein